MSYRTERPEIKFKPTQEAHEKILSELEGVELPDGFSDHLLRSLTTLATLAGLEGVFIAHGNERQNERELESQDTISLEGWGSAAGYLTGDVGLLVARGHSEDEIVSIRDSLGLDKGE